jgi:hypothetical protein
MESSEHKNGYNECVEKMLNLVQQEIAAPKNGETSINDHLRNLRRAILDTAFTRLYNGEVCTKAYIHGVEK